jgi:hypothetical protein
MTEIEHAPDPRVLVGIDISKHRHEVLIAAPGKQRRRRVTLTNTKADFERLVAILSGYGLPVRIGFEATGNYQSRPGASPVPRRVRAQVGIVGRAGLGRGRPCTTAGTRTTRRTRR